MAHTPGEWKRGMPGGCVVSTEPLPAYPGKGGHDEVEHYGGHLIAESIWRVEDARLIAAAPDLLAAAHAAWNCIGELPPTQARVEVAQLLQAAIEKSEGTVS